MTKEANYMVNSQILPWPTIMLRGFCRLCPNCGQGELFTSYLKQVTHCSNCNEQFGHIKADDGPAWLTILLVGHIFAPFLFGFADIAISDEVRILVLTFCALVMTFWLLPRAKGVFISIIWRAKCAGSEQ